MVFNFALRLVERCFRLPENLNNNAWAINCSPQHRLVSFFRQPEKFSS
ncbi:MAG: hypothetical protein IKI11_02770 [Neisseriaceae bacterium]|nr:hypothetical protein [Neisseriaceae bacterium]